MPEGDATMNENTSLRKSDSAGVQRQGAPADDRTRRRASSSDLLGTRRELLIDHLGEVYVLRHTSKGKLILTK